MPIEHITRFRCGKCGNVEEYVEASIQKAVTQPDQRPNLDATDDDIARLALVDQTVPKKEDDPRAPALSVTVGGATRAR